MKLNKKLEAEILKAYNDVWDAYLKGDMRTFASMLDENCYIIGSAAGELFNNKKSAVKYYKSTAHQITGKAEFRNRKINVMPADKGFMVNEESDFYLLIDDQWTYYGPARISSLFHKKNNKWKVIHQHGSFPDSKTEGGEQVNTEKIKAENVQLRDAVKRRTLELEQKNRELRIEAALERVRSRSMAMHKTDELLDAAELIHNELSALGINSMNVSYAFVDEDEKYGSYYSVNPVDGRIVPIPFVFPHTETEVMRSILSSWKKKESFNVIELNEKATQKHQTYIGEHIQKQLAKNSIPFSVGEFLAISPKKAVLSTFNFSNGYLFNIGGERLSKTQEELMLRFTRVFEQTYTRFLDLRKAEAQTKEAQIEASLERVRARAMSMQTSEELNKLIGTVFTELTKLDLVLTRSVILIYEGNEKGVRWWMANSEAPSMPMNFFIKYADLPFFNAYLKGWKERSLKWQYILEGKDKIRTDNFLFNETELSLLPDFVIAGMKANNRVYLSASFNNYGCLNLASVEPLSDEHFDILLRFAKVFDLTYTRFNDLKQAEAQAKEARIEAALERVRSRSMAMHSPEELKDVALELRNQLGWLEQPELEVCAIQLYEESPDYFEAWGAVRPPGDEGKIIQVQVQFPKKGIKIVDEMFRQYESGAQDYVLLNEGDKVPEWLNVLKERVPEGYEMVIQSLQGRRPEDTRAYWSMADFKGGSLVMTTYIPPSEEARKLLRRFSNVFGLAYRRFVDLKQAEAQAKEARIEVALERVRARTMAMQKSDELLETSSLLFQQIKELGETAVQVSIGIINEEAGFVELSTTIRGSHLPHTLNVPIDDPYVMGKAVTAWRAKRKSLKVEVRGKELKEYNEWRNKFLETKINFPEDLWIVNIIFFSKGWLSFSCDKDISGETLELLKRFAAVFEQTYTRFNDLKQAEAQGREAKIEAALEKVRSRTMAMQRSDELQDAAFLLFQQIQALGARYFACGFNIWDDDKKEATAWMAREQGFQPPFKTSSSEDVFFHIHEAAKRGESLFVAEQGGQALETHYDYMASIPIFKNILDTMAEAGLSVPPFQIIHCAFFSQGYLMFISFEPVPEAHDIFKRFAKVFEQTYTRFLDLQKAEAQSREAQIELALERVRARTMAMQKSEELADAAQLLYREFRNLGINTISCGYMFIDEEKQIQTAWVVLPDGSLIPNFIVFPLTGDQVLNSRYKDWKEKKPLHTFEIQGEVNKEHHRFLSNYVPPFVVNDIFSKIPDRVIFHCANFSDGYLLILATEFFSPEEQQTIIRFAKVFEMTYTRFNDLKQAEGQAREAKIEAALEKVRSRSLAMHKSEELQEVVNTVFERLQDLNIEMDSANIAIFKEGTRDLDYWIASPVQKRSASFHMPYFDLSLTRDIALARESGADFSAAAYSFEEKNKWFEYAFNNTDFRFLNEERIQFILNAPAITVAIAFSKNTGVQINRYANKLPSEGEIEVLKRFSKVFEQAYIRFLDLQKAETQAHEARIEIALERIRARALAMHKSDELMEVAKVLREQMALLGQPELEASVVHLYEADPDYVHSWRAVGIGTDAQTKLTYGHMVIPKNSCEVVREWLAKFQSELNEYTLEISGAKQREWYDLLFKLAPDVINSMLEEKSIHEKRYYRFSKFSGGALLMVSKREPSAEATYLQRKAAVVFDLAYRRFSDLQKAEAQARDAQIEASLERVRSKTMAMHNSQDVGDTVATMFDELVKLGIQTLRCGVGILHEGYQMELWTAKPNESGKIELFVGHLDMKLHPLLKGGYETWKDKGDSFSYELKDDDLIAYFNVINNYSGYQAKYDIASLPSRIFHYEFNFNEGCLFSFSLDQLSAESSQIFKRFAGVFGQTYRRYLDLQKAEAQAREAQIEASLERVRSKTMAMHNSEDVGETVATMLDELVKLGVETVRCGIAIIDESKTMEVWTASSKEDGSVKLIIGQLDMSIHPLFRMVYDAWKNKVPVTTYELIGEDLKDYFRAVNNSPDYPIRYDIESLPYKQSNTAFMFPEGLLFVFSQEPLIAETTQIFKRFAGVFGQTYRRYLDLQKAETQAREAKIEASLERVRAKAMAMHNSDDLHGAVTIMFEEFQKLNLNVLRCGIGILNKDSRTGAVWTTSVSDNGLAVQISANESFDTHPLMILIYEYWQKQEDLDYVLEGKDLINYYRAMDASELKLPKSQLSFSDDELQPQYYYAAMFNAGGLYSFSGKPFAVEDKNIMKRFASVVNLTYNRFLDLQKAEAQAREAKVEASLERVRAKAMAMHKSEDLNSAVATVFEELDKLNLGVLRCGISILDKEKRTGDIWVTSITDHGSAVQVSGDESFDIHPLLQGAFEAWLKKEDFYYLLEGDDLARYYEAVKTANFHLPESQLITSETEFKKQYCFTTTYGAGGLFAFRETEFPAEAKTVMKRFANVFDLTYKRFLDLQKAEANAREAKIEASLERVRAKAMAMHKTEDLNATVATVFEELQKLDLGVLRCGIPIFNKEKKTADVWTTSLDQGAAVQLTFRDESFGIHPLLQGAYEAWRRQVDFSYILQGEDIARYYKALETEKFHLPSSQVILSNVDLREQYYHIATFHAGGLFAFRDTEFSEEAKKVMKRFAGVFDLTYKRFLDLQKAEANAREAQIETGLERVRARTMAMHSSEDVSVATATMFTELEKLGIESFRGGILTIRADQTMDVWSVNNLAEGKIVRAAGKFDMTMHPFWQQLYKGWVNKDEVLYFDMSGKDKEDYVKILNARRDYLPTGMQELPDSHIQSYYFGEGFVWTFTLQPHSEEDKQVMKRFASVFSLTFRRYQDLLKAEAQAREATIEAALEKVRGKAMAMHNSNDLTATASLVFTELRKLGISPLRCGVGILNKENRKALLYSAVASEEGDYLSQFGWVLLDMNPVLKSIYDHWIGGQDYFPVLTKEMLKEYYAHLKVGFEVPDEHKEYEQYGYFIAFSEGMFYGWAERPFTESEIKILKRFASVIDLTFRRYMELQKSEANAREAVKQAALDRVRAEIASMRTVTDLERITPLIWNELTILGIAFIRCGVFIMDEEQQLIHTFLSTPDGKAIAAFHLPYDTPGNLSHVVSNWKVKKKYIDHWGQAEFNQFAEILVKQGALASAEQYLKTIPHDGFHLHFLPFLQGMLYVGNTTQLGEEEIELIQHVADAFSTAYARYEDFNKLEAAKQQVEKTLVDLKQAQTQLVQSEKMASLGELTAGIAHEIQNPLNFVNNFSDVSNELLEEMKTELEKGNAEDAMAIVEDVKQNLEKILHHGKRADAIVKGMLQHSRTSSGQKEPTDINVLADEYLRLSFHGLRAKDKLFNARFETEFDNSIGKINVIPQDIGRVILNLINNAFYAVTEKKKHASTSSAPNGYDPVVTVTTKKDNGRIEIKVKDNGNGIPPKVLDKIFQPFFTTKPTGQGTGLGLSLSYDIVTKGHGGELKVETKEGEGSEFVIQLPG